jgi:hypothetical protein
LIGHWDRDDHFLRSLILPFSNTYLVEVERQFRARTRSIFTEAPIIVSNNDRGISSRGFSWGRLIISDNSSLCGNKKESTHPSVIAAPKTSPQ